MLLRASGSASAEGLRGMADWAPLPAIAEHASGSAAYEAQIVWRRGDFMGVSLGEPVDVRAPTDERLKSVRNLWLAVAPS